MTREAKIGMLTGLGVIVLIGVLLSNYLGKNPSPRMANLPIGASYREQITQPVGVPSSQGEARGQAGIVPTPAYAVGETPSNVTTPEMGPMPGQPVIASPVTPQPDGRVLAYVPRSGDNIPTIQLPDVQPAAPAPAATSGTPAAGVAAVTPASPAKPAPIIGKEYVIAPGDTLAKIAVRFYKSSKPEFTQKIVAANSSVLKNDKTMLVVGKKLIIPNPPPAAPVVAEAPKIAVRTTDLQNRNIMVRLPGAAAPSAGEAKPLEAHAISVKADAPKKDVPSVYVIKQGDTIGSIAAHYVGTGDKNESAKMAARIMSVNKIKDPSSLQIGMKIKLPAKV